MNRAGRILKAEIYRFIDHPIDRPQIVSMFIFLGQLVKPLHVFAEELCLIDGLSIVLCNPFRRPVGRKDDKGRLAEVCLGDSRPKVVNGRAGSAYHYDGIA